MTWKLHLINSLSRVATGKSSCAEEQDRTQGAKQKLRSGIVTKTGRYSDKAEGDEEARSKDNNPTGDKGKTGTMHGGEHRCTALDTNETRVAEGRCRSLNNQGVGLGNENRCQYSLK
ncbi:hypothetical protein EYF80_063465 [Liparis tanakae]|uniref:Uncharacterized protein n=1 Tax=Liparis tanakae TaxID=230148 RepID=A0A4Z2ECA9_9TELE|nr:hypothetical protein EYF80_063465 [Liparis tanakae]